ncbi:hypothetical protein Q1695_014859 [Nippostrongylus brasiliensis]|nr:hypothetical protein Q1695_014859 [Nippostrongylus brasiliensis]
MTYSSGGRKTEVDHILVRRRALKTVRDVKVLPIEDVAMQHRKLVADLNVILPPKVKVRTEPRIRWWKLRDSEQSELKRREVAAVVTFARLLFQSKYWLPTWDVCIMTCDQPVKISDGAQSTAINTPLPAVPGFLSSFEPTRLVRLLVATFDPTLLTLSPDPPQERLRRDTPTRRRHHRRNIRSPEPTRGNRMASAWLSPPHGTQVPGGTASENALRVESLGAAP